MVIFLSAVFEMLFNRLDKLLNSAKWGRIIRMAPFIAIFSVSLQKHEPSSSIQSVIDPQWLLRRSGHLHINMQSTLPCWFDDFGTISPQFHLVFDDNFSDQEGKHSHTSSSNSKISTSNSEGDKTSSRLHETNLSDLNDLSRIKSNRWLKSIEKEQESPKLIETLWWHHQWMSLSSLEFCGSCCKSFPQSLEF